ncbi:uncharacterized protein LOC106404180 [Brassica napus]|uniref:uncharacterized protein LOC106297335 n=1 Tax=Brassica oleracea var. oleracea TaxID=109376 RepID=UPI0006A7548F|nr:PREDICTED: uncharacterized protein LOC106297335 [Brassica oleracea var. oleracea]XP_013700375.2 uncharacterized protein LOC106404180 [Brassica napus]
MNKGNNLDPLNWKKCVWNIKCSPKLQHFLWNVKSNALDVGETLSKCGIQTEGKCKRCGASESILHVIILCPYAQRVWKLASILTPPSTSSDASMAEILQACTKMINLPPTGLVTLLYPWIFWVLWTSRNQLMFEDKSFSETETMLKAIKATVEWQEAIKLPTATKLPTKKSNYVSIKDCSLMNLNPQISINASALYSDAA